MSDKSKTSATVNAAKRPIFAAALRGARFGGVAAGIIMSVVSVIGLVPYYTSADHAFVPRLGGNACLCRPLCLVWRANWCSNHGSLRCSSTTALSDSDVHTRQAITGWPQSRFAGYSRCRPSQPLR